MAWRRKNMTWRRSNMTLRRNKMTWRSSIGGGRCQHLPSRRWRRKARTASSVAASQTSGGGRLWRLLCFNMKTLMKMNMTMMTQITKMTKMPKMTRIKKMKMKMAMMEKMIPTTVPPTCSPPKVATQGLIPPVPIPTKARPPITRALGAARYSTWSETVDKPVTGLL